MRLKRFLKPLILAVVLLAACLLSGQIQNQSDDGQWIMPAKNYASTRYSALNEINTANVKNLKLDWSFSTGLAKGLPAWSGAVATAGDVVFYGTMDGWFKALDARSGSLLWQFKVGSGIISQPVTYKGPDGRQFVAVLSGELNPKDGTGALGFVNAMADLPKYTTKGGILYVFGLP